MSGPPGAVTVQVGSATGTKFGGAAPSLMVPSTMALGLSRLIPVVLRSPPMRATAFRSASPPTATLPSTVLLDCRVTVPLPVRSPVNRPLLLRTMAPRACAEAASRSCKSAPKVSGPLLQMMGAADPANRVDRAPILTPALPRMAQGREGRRTGSVFEGADVAGAVAAQVCALVDAVDGGGLADGLVAGIDGRAIGEQRMGLHAGGAARRAGGGDAAVVIERAKVGGDADLVVVDTVGQPAGVRAGVPD